MNEQEQIKALEAAVKALTERVQQLEDWVAATRSYRNTGPPSHPIP